MDRFELRLNFVIKHKKLFSQYSKINGYPQGSNFIVKSIAEKAREEIGYSVKTSSCDIAWTLNGLYKETKKILLLN
jgi:hypothetical protein